MQRAEKALGLCFPPTYRRFLLELGAGDVDGAEIYGLLTDDFEDLRPCKSPRVNFTVHI